VDLWITGTPPCISHGQPMDSKLPTACPHLIHSSVNAPVTHNPTSSDDNTAIYV